MLPACRASPSPEWLARPLRVPQASIYTKVGRLIRDADGGPLAAGVGFEDPGAVPLDQRSITNDYTVAGVECSHRESLQRLGVERVHTLRIHDPNDNQHVCRAHGGNASTAAAQATLPDEVAIAAGSGGAAEGLVALREGGVIEHVSIGMNSNEEAHQVPDLVACARPSPAGGCAPYDSNPTAIINRAP